MAQETFITAWNRLKELRDPAKLRQWLCGIVRNIAANAVRREMRRGGEPESLDAALEELSIEDNPAVQTITREEERLLWRTLAEMPETYLEPLVLFIARIGRSRKLRSNLTSRVGLVIAYFGTKAAASTARSKAERDHIVRYAWGITAFCFLMSIALVAALSQAGKLYTASPALIVLGVGTWTTVLVGAIIVACQRLDRGVKRIRLETGTTNEVVTDVRAAQGKGMQS